MISDSFIHEEEKDKSVDDLVREVVANRYDHTAEIPPEPDYILYIDGKGIILPGGSVIGVYGQPKSRKSSLMGMIAAACLNDEGKFENIESRIEKGVAWFDTEQSDMEVQYFQNNIVKMSGQEDDEEIRNKHFVFKLRPYDEEERLDIVDRMITAPNILNNIGLIVLDGIADFIYNVNEIEASKKLVTRLTFWADYLKVPFIVALHTNKDGKDATGSLGGFINKKASYTIKCEPEYENGPSQIRPYFTRNGKNFTPFLIDNDEETGMPKIHDPFEDEVSVDFSSKSRSKLDLEEKAKNNSDDETLEDDKPSNSYLDDDNDGPEENPYDEEEVKEPKESPFG